MSKKSTDNIPEARLIYKGGIGEVSEKDRAIAEGSLAFLAYGFNGLLEWREARFKVEENMEVRKFLYDRIKMFTHVK